MKKRDILIAGDSLPSTDGFWEFAKMVQWPVLVDPLSNLRTSVPADCMDLCIDQYDAILKNDAFQTNCCTKCRNSFWSTTSF